MSGVRAYSFADKTTWVGRFNEDKRTLEDAIIFTTPTTDDFESAYIGMDVYFRNMYQAEILKRRAHRIEDRPVIQNFKPTEAIGVVEIGE